MYGNKGNYRLYLKPLYSRLDRLAQSQSSPFSAEAQLEHVKILFIQISYSVSKKIRAETIGLKFLRLLIVEFHFIATILIFYHLNLNSHSDV